MKKCYLCTSLAIISMWSTGLFAQQGNVLIPNQILVTSRTLLDPNLDGFVLPYYYGHLYSIEPVQPFQINCLLIDIALNDTTKVHNAQERTRLYPYHLDQLSPLNLNSIKESFGGGILEGVNQDGTRVTIEKEMDTIQIRAIDFIESWTLDTMKNSFNKEVVAFIPIRVHNESYNDDVAVQQCCIIENPAPTSEPGQLIARVKYEVYLFDYQQTGEYSGASNFDAVVMKTEMPDAPSFSSYSRQVLLNYLWKSATEQKLPAYDFQTNKRIVEVNEIYSLLGRYEYEADVLDAVENKHITQKISDYNGVIKSVVFCEEWYFQPQTGYISKRVLGIAPVLWDNETGTRKPCFTLWFDRSKMF